MRKIFTILFILCLSYRWIDVQAQILWGGPSDPNSTFAGGFNGWTTAGLSSADPTKADSATWYYSAGATAAGGAYYGTRTAINSTSKSNGAMVFNSDLYDNGGVAGAFGLGKCPSPHSGVLISPVINCSTFGSVALKFNQYYRNFQSTCFVDVTNDGGATWVPFSLNTDIVTNAETATNSQPLINISSVAANQSNVQIRFRFDGEYYFWIVDDVQLVKVPDYDLALNSHFYTPQSYRQPQEQICQDTFIFQANLNNKGGIAQTRVVLRGEILSIDRKTVLFKDSVIVDRLEPTQNDTPFKTNNYFVPNTSNLASPGKYYFRYTIYSMDATGADFNPKDNVRLDSFEISSDTYAKAPRGTGGVRAGNGAAYTFGNQYRTSDCWNSNDGFKAKECKFQLVANPGGTLNGYNATIYLLKVHDDVDAGFTNFDATMGIGSPSIDIKSEAPFTGTTEQSNTDIIIELRDFDNDSPFVYLAKNSRYFLGVDHPATASGDIPVFQVISNEKSYNSQPFSTFVIDDSGAWFNGFQGTNTPICDLNIEKYFLVNTDNKPLPSSVMELYPNPVVNNVLKVKLSFDNATDANLAIADINGKLLSFESHFGVTKDEFTIKTNQLEAGNYLIRVSTEEGTRTKQFTVVK